MSCAEFVVGFFFTAQQKISAVLFRARFSIQWGTENKTLKKYILCTTHYALVFSKISTGTLHKFTITDSYVHTPSIEKKEVGITNRYILYFRKKVCINTYMNRACNIYGYKYYCILNHRTTYKFNILEDVHFVARNRNCLFNFEQ